MVLPRLQFLVTAGLALVGLLAGSTLGVSAHAYPATTTASAGARLDAPPVHIGIGIPPAARACDNGYPRACWT